MDSVRDWNGEKVDCDYSKAPYTDAQFAFFSEALERIQSLPPEEYNSQETMNLMRGIRLWMGRYGDFVLGVDSL